MAEDPTMIRSEFAPPSEIPQGGIVVEFANPSLILADLRTREISHYLTFGHAQEVSQTLTAIDASVLVSLPKDKSDLIFFRPEGSLPPQKSAPGLLIIKSDIKLANNPQLRAESHRGFYTQERVAKVLAHLAELGVNAHPDKLKTDSRFRVKVADGEVEVDLGPNSQESYIDRLRFYSDKDQRLKDLTAGTDSRSIKIETSFKNLKSDGLVDINQFNQRMSEYQSVMGKLLNAVCLEAGEIPPDKKITFQLGSPPQVTEYSPAKAGVNPVTEVKNTEVKSGVEKMFAQLPQLKPEEKDPSYYLDSKEPLRDLESSKPFFVNIKLNPNGTFSFAVNPEVVPYVYSPIAQTERFKQAEAATNGDSGLFAICAVAAETPAAQAEVYKKAAEVVLKVHQNNSSLLTTWLEKQRGPNKGSDFPPFYIFASHDMKLVNGIPQPRPSQEQLVIFALEADSILDTPKFESVWSERIQELNTAVADQSLQPHHIRWIEFLSHSIDQPKLFDRLKNQI